MIAFAGIALWLAMGLNQMVVPRSADAYIKMCSGLTGECDERPSQAIVWGERDAMGMQAGQPNQSAYPPVSICSFEPMPWEVCEYPGGSVPNTKQLEERKRRAQEGK